MNDAPKLNRVFLIGLRQFADAGFKIGYMSKVWLTPYEVAREKSDEIVLKDGPSEFALDKLPDGTIKFQGAHYVLLDARGLG